MIPCLVVDDLQPTIFRLVEKPDHPLQCSLCQEQVSVKAALWHRNKEHPDLSQPSTLLDPITKKKLLLSQLYKCLGMCPFEGCNKMMGGQGYELLKFNLRSHYARTHGDPGEHWDFPVLLPRTEGNPINKTETTPACKVPERTPIKSDISLSKGI